MSEPIQSIAQNNYILHNIDAKKLYVQEPLFTANSGDAVYVGWRPDETVLWEGNLNQPSAISLSEKSNNFNTIKMYLNDQNGWKEVKEYNADQWQFGLTLTTPYASNRNSTIIRYGILSSTNYIDYTYTAVGRALLTTGSNNYALLDNSGPFIEKIVGINRKENA